MTSLEICHAIVACLDGTVQMHVTKNQTIVTAGENTPYGLFIAFDPQKLADALGIRRNAVGWQLVTTHVWNGKKIVPHYDGMLDIRVVSDDAPEAVITCE